MFLFGFSFWFFFLVLFCLFFVFFVFFVFLLLVFAQSLPSLIEQKEVSQEPEEHKEAQVDHHANPVVVGPGQVELLQDLVTACHRANRSGAHRHQLPWRTGVGCVMKLIRSERLESPFEQGEVLQPAKPSRD